MHLLSRTRQTAFVSGADLQVDFEAGETIWTESSHKFHISELAAMAEQCGFSVEGQWMDREWPFLESIWMVQ
jgi:L-histidine Nalpha-methyltransferase